jgi:hypothetical protein
MIIEALLGLSVPYTLFMTHEQEDEEDVKEPVVEKRTMRDFVGMRPDDLVQFSFLVLFPA